MLKWFKALLAGLQPAKPIGPATVLKQLDSSSAPISSNASWADEELYVEVDRAETVALFEVPLQGQQQCMLTYRVKISTKDLAASAYLELWCRVPGFGESFSRGLHQKVSGTNNFMTLEIPFYLRKDQMADQLKLNLVFEGAGSVRLREIEVLSTPLSS